MKGYNRPNTLSLSPNLGADLTHTVRKAFPRSDRISDIKSLTTVNSSASSALSKTNATKQFL
jgi:hypothetical protein